MHKTQLQDPGTEPILQFRGSGPFSEEAIAHMNVFYTVNSGFYLRSADFGILVDGLHRGEQVGFSAVPQTVRTALNTHTAPFNCPMAFLFTHTHPDHFDPESLALAAPSAAVYGPDVGALPFQVIAPGIRKLLLPEGCAYAFQVPHEGKAFSDVPHHALLILLDGQCILMAGDGEFSPEIAHTMLEFCPCGVDAVCVNPYQLISPSTRAFLSLLHPSSVLLSHLPFPQDDKLGCYALADHAIAHYPAGFPPLTRLTPMSWFHIPLHS